MVLCNNCSTIFGDKIALNCHLTHSRCKRKQLPNFDSQFNPQNKLKDAPLYEEQVFQPEPAIQQRHVPISNQYLIYQDNFLLALEKYASHRDMNKVKMSNSKFAKGDHEIYLAIILYTTVRPQMSADDNTELIKLIKAISLKNGNEIPLPSRYIFYLTVFYFTV